ncbi:MAG TPA: hypothetical protein RMH99_21160 [Sandaracinaceae bacterium LLY-WYZ-13_1]|nr:hypothetical protein [Sandaracinaceae bacterium LLY-WYZ-13_1]
MTAPNPDDRLQQYFDGELAGEDAEVLRRELETDEALRAELDGLEQLATLLRASADARAHEVDGDALFAAIEAKLEVEGEAGDDDDPLFPTEAPAEVRERRPKLSVVAGGRAEAEAAAPPARDEKTPHDGPGTGTWIGIAATAIAAAAALVFWLTRPSDRVDEPGDRGAPTVAEHEPPPGSEVEDVDFGYNTGAVFSVEGDEGEQYAVVWISDEKVSDEGERTEERIQ